MSRVTVAGAALLALALGFGVLPRSTAQERSKPAPTGSPFDRMILAVNYKIAETFNASLLKNAREGRIGGREFLVGEYAVEGQDEYAEFQGVEIWIPLENVENVMVFSDYATARRVSERFRQPGPGAPPR